MILALKILEFWPTGFSIIMAFYILNNSDFEDSGILAHWILNNSDCSIVLINYEPGVGLSQVAGRPEFSSFYLILLFHAPLSPTRVDMWAWIVNHRSQKRQGRRQRQRQDFVMPPSPTRGDMWAWIIKLNKKTMMKTKTKTETITKTRLCYVPTTNTGRHVNLNH